jgi:hypothetical protein
MECEVYGSATGKRFPLKTYSSSFCSTNQFIEMYQEICLAFIIRIMMLRIELFQNPDFP